MGLNKITETVLIGNMMMGMDDAVQFFMEVAQILDDSDIETDEDFPKRYTQAMNRIRYECAKSCGVPVKKLKKRSQAGYFEMCGNCGSECIDGNRHYRFCPNCGYEIKW